MRPPSGDSIDVDVDINMEKEMAPRWIFLIAFALVFYGTGAAFIESFVNYPSWHLIGADEFIAYHRFISPRVLAFLVAPLLLGTAFSILMLWSRPAAIPAWAVWTAIAAQAVVWASTVTIQVPIQFQLGDHGLSADLLNRLIETNFWLRGFRMRSVQGCSCGWQRKSWMQVTRGVPPDQSQGVYKAPFAGVTVFWAGSVVLRSSDSVEFTRHRPPPALQRGTCRACGAPVLGYMRLAPFLRLAFVPTHNLEPQPCAPQPSCHIIYRRRHREAADSLPKFVGYWRSELAVTRLILSGALRSDA